MKKLNFLFALIAYSLVAQAQTAVTISNPENWRNSDLSAYVGKTVRFNVPFYVCNNYSSSSLTVSPRRIFSPTNQAYPSTPEYSTIVSTNNSGTVSLTGISGYHRMGECIVGLTVKVNSTSSLSAVGTQTFVGNTRANLATPPYLGNRDSILVVCAMNLEYFLVDNLGTGYGPDNTTEANKQYTKIIKALTAINADIYGLVEIEQGQAALAKLASGLTSALGRHFIYVNDGGSASGSYTKSGYLYCDDKVTTYGQLQNNNTGVSQRKKMIAFVDNKTGEKFIFSINHFKAKSGTGTGLDADQGDGQGIFNNTRTLEAQSVIDVYNSKRTYFGDNDILIMGDLNAYAKEDPIKKFLNAGFIDLHRAFHADSSYSYTYKGQAGYLDHAIANSSMKAQITGMAAYHINSDESDSYTYDKSNDATMFRSSDHDPVLVGIRLGHYNEGSGISTPQNDIIIKYDSNRQPSIKNAEGCLLRLYTLSGKLATAQTTINSNDYRITGLPLGLYIANIYGKGTQKQGKIIVTQYSAKE